MSWNDQIGSDFSYNVGINGAYNKNKVGNIPTEDGIIHGDVNMLYDNSPEFYRAENGHAIGYFWGYQTAGFSRTRNRLQTGMLTENMVFYSLILSRVM